MLESDTVQPVDGNETRETISAQDAERPNWIINPVPQVEVLIEEKTVLVDERIAGAVVLLNKLGYRTFSSCQGMIDGHRPNEKPYVLVVTPLEFDLTVQILAWRLSHDLRAFTVSECSSVVDKTALPIGGRSSYIKIEFLEGYLP